jgi:hypothetical protein
MSLPVASFLPMYVRALLMAGGCYERGSQKSKVKSLLGTFHHVRHLLYVLRTWLALLRSRLVVLSVVGSDGWRLTDDSRRSSRSSFLRTCRVLNLQRNGGSGIDAGHGWLLASVYELSTYVESANPLIPGPGTFPTAHPRHQQCNC